MTSQKTTAYSKRQPPVADDDFDLRGALTKYLYYWPVFILCVVLSLAAAYAYKRVAKPVYEIKATMLLQDNSRENSNALRSTLQELDLTTPPKLVENQIEILQSRRLVEIVVNNLQLWASYTLDNKPLKQDLYGKSPIKFSFVEASGNGGKKLAVEIVDQETYILKQSDDPEQRGQEHSFGDTVRSSLGSWRLDRTRYFNRYVGSVITVNIADKTATIDGYQGAVEVALKDKMASAVEITVHDKNPERGEDFANYLITVYNNEETAEKNRIAKSTLDFIDKRLDSLVIELNSAEGNVEKFRSERSLTDINTQSLVYLQNEQANDAKLNDVTVQLRVINSIENYINAPDVSERAVPSTIGISDQNLINSVQTFINLQQERNRLLATTPERNPVFDPINRQIIVTRTAIRENIKNIKLSLITQQRTLQSIGSRFKSSIQSIPGEERQLTGLKRQTAIKENLYTYLLQKREEVSLRYASTLANARLVDVAYTVPIKTSKAMLPYAAALLLGLLLPAAIIYTRDLIKNQITTRREIEKGLPLPIVGEFEFAKLKSPIVTDPSNERNTFMIIEQFRSLRTQLHYLHGTDAKGRVTMVASSVSGEGKSFIVSNTAVALATSGKRTIILELNLYKPAIGRIFGLPESHPGMSNYLNWASLKEEVIQNSATYRNLDIITAGQFLTNFSELLDRKRIEVLIDWLRLNYDHILIDTSPLEVIGDATIVSRLCDITLYVVRKNFTSKTELPFITKLYDDQQLPDISIIFNCVDKVRDGYRDYFPDRANG